MALLVAGDFNAGKLQSVLPNFYQHVKCATRGKTILYHLYSTHRDAYKALPRPPFGKSDHNSWPAFKPKLRQEAPVTWSIKSGQMMKQMLNYRTVLLAQTGICSRDSSDGIEEFTTSVTSGFINKTIEDVVPTGTVCTYPTRSHGLQATFALS